MTDENDRQPMIPASQQSGGRSAPLSPEPSGGPLNQAIGETAADSRRAAEIGPSEVPHKLRRLCVAVVTFALAAAVLTMLNISGNNLAGESTKFGFPHTFLQAYGIGRVVRLTDVLTDVSLERLVFIRALVFDVIVAVLAAVATAFTLRQWSASWSSRGVAAFYGSCTTFCALIGVAWIVDVPTPLGIVLLFVFLLAIPLLFVCCAAYSIWCWSQSLFGPRPGGIAFVLVICSLVGFAYWAFPYGIHDKYDDPTSADVPFLLERRLSGNPGMRQLAVQGLGHAPVNDDAVVNALVDSISDANYLVRWEAMCAVTRFGAKSARAVPALIAALGDKANAMTAASALGDIGPNAKAAIPVLRAALPATTGYDKLNIAKALWKIEGDAPLVVPPLLDLLHDDFDPIRQDAASILGEIGPPAKAAVPTLIEMIRHVPSPRPRQRSNPNGAPGKISEAEYYPQIRKVAAEALFKIDPKAVVAPQKK